MREVGTVTKLRSNGANCMFRWKVDNFLRGMQQEYTFRSPNFRFRSLRFYLLIPDSYGKETYEPEVFIYWPLGTRKDVQFSWRFSVRCGVGGKIIQCGQNVEEGENPVVKLGYLQDVGRLLCPDGSLELLWEFSIIPEGTASTLSPSLQHPASVPSQTSAQTKKPSTTSLSHASTQISTIGSDTVMRDLEKLLSSGEGSDATVRVKGGREFLVHRAILIARTPVFASLFRHRMLESDTGILDIEDCNSDTFQRFLHFIYTGSVEDLCLEDAMELYRVADKYQVDELKSHCLEYISRGLNVETFCPTISLALLHCEMELTAWATEFFTNNIDKIVLTVPWQEFLSKNPIQANELIIKALQKKAALLEQIPPTKKRRKYIT